MWLIFEASDSLPDSPNTFTTVGQDPQNRSGSDSVSAYLPASLTFVYDPNGNLLYDGQKALAYDDENQLRRITYTNLRKSELT